MSRLRRRHHDSSEEDGPGGRGSEVPGGEVAGQDAEPADGTGGRWRIARKVAPGRVISTVDPQARHTRKSKSWRRDGFRGHVAAEPETGLVTGCEMTMAAGPGSTDAENGVKMAARDRFTGTPGSTGPGQEPDAPGSASPEPDGPHGEQAEERLEIYGDSSYGSGEARAACRDAGHDTVIKPGPLGPAVPCGFTIDDFTVDEEHGTVTCQPGRSDEQDPDRHLRRGLRRLPATAAVHHREGRPVHDHPPA